MTTLETTTVPAAIAKAIAHHTKGETDIAAAIFDQLLCQLESPDPNVLYGYGTILVAQQKFGLGITLLQTALRMYPNNPIGWANIGVAFKFIGRDDLALDAYNKAYAIDPNMPEVLAGIAGYWIGKDAPDKVEEFSRRALAIQPDLPAAKMHLGMALLEQGRYEEAWPYYEWRWETAEKINDKRPYKAPRWNGERVSTLAIHGEQGLGDEIMFMSLLSAARKRADRVVIECADRLVGLFRSSFGVVCYPDHKSLIAAEGEPDAYIPMGSLPMILGLPDGKPYMRRAPHSASGGRPRIGVAWKGGTYRTGGSDRTVTLEQLKPIFDAVDATFVSVQYGEESIDTEAVGFGLVSGQRDLDSLQSRIASCDLVITVCQTALHQAGAMGVPCIVMVPRKAPWVVCGKTMPWYESLELVRQETSGDWTPVINQIADRLRDRYGLRAA